MDIGIIFPFLDSWGGAQKYLFECLKRWNKKNDTTIYTVTYNKELYKEYDSLGYNVTILNPPVKAKLMNLPLLLQKNIISKQIDKHEIYNSHMFPLHSLNLENNIWTPQEPSRILYDLRILLKNTNFPKRLLYNMTAPALRKIDKNSYKAAKTIANSNYSKKYLESIYNIQINNVIYPGVSYKKYNEEIVEKDMKKIVVVSRLYYEKRIDIAIKTLSYLDDSYTLEIIGKGSYFTELNKLTRKLNLTKRVKFLNFVSNADLIRKYQEALCVIFTPYREPFGMVVLESMAAGTPLIGCEGCGGYTEIIEKGHNGYLVDFNPKSIAEKIKYLSENQEIYNKISDNCRDTAKKYTWKKTANETMQVFKEYLNNQ